MTLQWFEARAHQGRGRRQGRRWLKRGEGLAERVPTVIVWASRSNLANTIELTARPRPRADVLAARVASWYDTDRKIFGRPTSSKSP